MYSIFKTFQLTALMCLMTNHVSAEITVKTLSNCYSDGTNIDISCSAMEKINITRVLVQTHVDCGKQTSGSCKIDTLNEVKAVCQNKLGACSIASEINTAISSDEYFDCDNFGSHYTQYSIDYTCDSDGEWSEWKYKTNCSKSCGYETREQTRECKNQKNYGSPCKGASSNWTVCLENKFCSNCNGSVNERVWVDQYIDNRGCVDNGHCFEHDKQTGNRCYRKNVAGSWTNWGEWSGCTKSCGEGTKKRQRTCTVGFGPNAQCEGVNDEYAQCNRQKCEELELDEIISVSSLEPYRGSIKEKLAKEVTQITCALRCKVKQSCRRACWVKYEISSKYGDCYSFSPSKPPKSNNVVLTMLL